MNRYPDDSIKYSKRQKTSQKLSRQEMQIAEHRLPALQLPTKLSPTTRSIILLWVSLPKEMSGVNYINLLQQPIYKSHFSQNRLIQISFLNLPNTLTFQQILFQITSVTNYIQPVNLYQDKHIINYLDSAYSVSFKIWVQNVTFKYFTDSIWDVSYTQLTNRELKVISVYSIISRQHYLSYLEGLTSQIQIAILPINSKNQKFNSQKLLEAEIILISCWQLFKIFASQARTMYND
ncbi:Hypothetical_protein [Hexamita inflata]|uniref:Hypothetical_protein n=1 Tax=Hexamita inflata TaxID=28002 RepID=A0AA86PGL3_9EUKA|nr:Hypothetical protein HINF_LOCUS25903 [Hexamita inflata]